MKDKKRSPKKTDNDATQLPLGPGEIRGVISAVVYHSADSGYTVLRVDEESLGEVTAVGTLGDAGEGEMIRATGAWTEHAEYGRQFRISSLTQEMPSGADAILRYLSSGAVAHIRVKTAIKIVNKFGADTFEVLEKHPLWLAEIPGISQNKAREIGESFAERSGMRNLMMLCGSALPPSVAVRAYKLWGSAAAETVRTNPYILAERLDGVGFLTADKLARETGFCGDPSFRVRCGIIHVLNMAASQGGHCCLPRELLYEEGAKLLLVPGQTIIESVNSLLSDGELVAERDGLIYRRSMWEAERDAARRLCELERCCPNVGVEDTDAIVSVIETESGIRYAGLQRTAIFSAVENGVSVITGGPGTGKTTVILALLRIFEEMGMDCALAAPTGRAAKRMSEATRHEARTVHRLLEMDYNGEDGEKQVFLRDEASPLDARAVIIDEASMLDIYLFGALLAAIRPGSHLVLIGDGDQLPSVGAGNVLRDIIASGAFTTVRLTEIFRQARESLIVRNAHAVNHGEMPDTDSTKEDFFFLSRDNAAETAKTIVDLCNRRLPASYGEMGRGGVQVITPSRRGIAGTENLNLMLRNVLNPAAPEKTERSFGTRMFREGDKVMQTRNNYELSYTRHGKEGKGVYNGDIGEIVRLDSHEDWADIRFDDRTVMYDYSAFEDLELAYAVTVHKSQGSEYPIVILPLYPCAPMLLTRNMLYTALTRAKTYAILVGSRDILKQMVENNSEAVRYSGLARRITELMPGAK